MSELISRAEARARGLKHYFTGNPCKYGHISIRRTDAKTCMRCKSNPGITHFQRQRSSALLLEAKQMGLTEYLTGIPCRNGHLAPRYVKNSGCIKCTAISNKRCRDKHVEDIRKKALARYYENKPEIRKKKREYRQKAAAALRALQELGIEV